MRCRLGMPILAALALVASVPGPRATTDVRLVPGAWVRVKGEFGPEGLFVARQIEGTDDRRASLKGPLDGIDLALSQVRFGALALPVDDATRIEDDAGATLAIGALRPGQRVKIALDIVDGTPVHVRRIRVLDGMSTDRRLEGPFGSFVRNDSGGLDFLLLGVNVRSARAAARSGGFLFAVDDEDIRPDKGLWLGNVARFSGEVRFDYKDKRNFDLADTLDRDLTTRRARTELELTFPGNGRISGMAELKAFQETAVHDEAGVFTRRDDFTLGETYVQIAGLLGRRGSLQVGRARFDDQRDWLFRRDLDALRLFFDWSRLHVETSLSRQVVDPERRQRDIVNQLVLITAYPGHRHRVSAYYLGREDHHIQPNGLRRDFSPDLAGVRAAGEGGHWLYWADAALARGSIEGQPLRGKAYDAGGTWIFPSRFEPSLTVGYAVGSGDSDPTDGVDRTFRQSGLQLNNGKWNGVTNFRYYGELLRPELANLRISTYGFGLRVSPKSSIDLVWHRYDLDEPASELVNDGLSDRRLDLVHRDVGRELDLVVGIEDLAHLEFEIDLGVFDPGEAFLGRADRATTLRVKAKYVF
ncbi:MAG: alginate export family protein [Acidobacteriota bacterium]